MSSQRSWRRALDSATYVLIFPTDRAKQLSTQSSVRKVFHAITVGVCAGNLGGAEQHIPDKHQVAIIASTKALTYLQCGWR